MRAAFDGMQKRVVVVEGLWPNHAFEEGIGINLLTSADPGLPGGGAVFHDTSVWLRPGLKSGPSTMNAPNEVSARRKPASPELGSVSRFAGAECSNRRIC